MADNQRPEQLDRGASPPKRPKQPSFEEMWKTLPEPVREHIRNITQGEDANQEVRGLLRQSVELMNIRHNAEKMASMYAAFYKQAIREGLHTNMAYSMTIQWMAFMYQNRNQPHNDIGGDGFDDNRI